MQTIRTARDARKAQEIAEMNTPAARAEAKRNAIAKVDAENDAIAAQHPEIGKLIRKGRPVFYVTIGGNMIEAIDPRVLVAELATEARIAELEAEGMTRSDAQAVVEVQDSMLADGAL